MTTVTTNTTDLQLPDDAFAIDDAQLAAVAFLARYSGRTLDAYRHDLRGFFQWAADNGLAVLAATRPAHRAVPQLDGRPRTGGVDDRPAPLDGVRLLPLRSHRRSHRLEPGPVRPPAAGAPVDGRGLDRSELGVFLFTAERYDRDHAALAVLLGSERAASERGVRHQRRGPRLRTRPSHAAHPRQGQQARHHPARPAHGAHHRPRRRRTPAKVRSCAATTANGSTAAPPTAGFAPSASAPASARCTRTCSAPRSSWPPSTPACRSGTCRLAARHADPRTTTIYDRRRQNFDRHAAYVVVAFVAGG